MKIAITLICIIASTIISNGQSILKDSLLLTISQAKYYETDYFEGNSSTFDASQQLIKISNPAELIQLTNHKSPIVRLYAFEGLIIKQVNDTVLLKILQNHRNDSSSFIINYGDFTYAYKVNEDLNNSFELKHKILEKKARIGDYIKLIIKKSYIKENQRHISKNDLLSLDSLYLSNNQLPIISFRLSAKVGDYFYEATSSNNKITEEMKHFISQINTKTKVYIEDIKIESLDKKTRTWGVELLIVE